MTYDELEDRIGTACASVGRDRSEVTLIGVSKTVDAERIQVAYDRGLRDFGESRLQEALPKMQGLPRDIKWHFIGTLQSNKAKKIAESFEIIHTLCKPSQLKEIAKAERMVEALIEVNIAEESQKSGVFLTTLDEFLESAIQCPWIRVRGLMTIGPALGNPEAMRPYFGKLRMEAERLGLPWLSMGMSSDFEVAIQEGSTHIRVGSALFGAR